MSESKLPPVTHGCCGTPCFYEHKPELPCWGVITCVDTDYTNEGEEYRTGACSGHSDMYPSFDEKKYEKPPQGEDGNNKVELPASRA